MKAVFDHIVIGASDLAEDVERVEAALGAPSGGGGAHPLMSTHNRLMRLSGTQGWTGGYLEVIAVDPAASAPSRTRWYTLDDPVTTTRLAERPRALCWVASVPDLDEATRVCGYDPGQIIEVTRGALRWRLTVPEDGGLAADGILPALIEWPEGVNPVAALPVQDIALDGIVATHPDPAFISGCMRNLGLGQLLTVTRGHSTLAFDMVTPSGTVRID